jgi:hypothetical protein
MNTSLDHVTVHAFDWGDGLIRLEVFAGREHGAAFYLTRDDCYTLADTIKHKAACPEPTSLTKHDTSTPDQNL